MDTEDNVVALSEWPQGAGKQSSGSAIIYPFAKQPNKGQICRCKYLKVFDHEPPHGCPCFNCIHYPMGCTDKNFIPVINTPLSPVDDREEDQRCGITVSFS